MARSMEVPFTILPDGSKVLTYEQLTGDVALMQFYNRFKSNFTTMTDMNAVKFNDPNAGKDRIWDAIKGASR